MSESRETGHFRRFHGYDYTRGAAMFLTFHLEPRVPLFGRVDGDRMAYSPVGMIARRVLARERDRTPDVQLKRSIIMPEHVHLRLYLRPGQANALIPLGRFVYNFKAWTRNRAKTELGVELRWQRNYHDRICPSREIIALADKYIDNNPRKWTLMHGHPPPLKVVEPLAAACLPANEWWTGSGASTGSTTRAFGSRRCGCRGRFRPRWFRRSSRGSWRRPKRGMSWRARGSRRASASSFRRWFGGAFRSFAGRKTRWRWCIGRKTTSRSCSPSGAISFCRASSPTARRAASAGTASTTRSPRSGAGEARAFTFSGRGAAD